MDGGTADMFWGGNKVAKIIYATSIKFCLAEIRKELGSKEVLLLVGQNKDCGWISPPPN